MTKNAHASTKRSPTRDTTDGPGTSAESPGQNHLGTGGEIHQTSEGAVLTTNQGIPVSDDQNSLKAGARGPTLLEDFVLREKITHFDHERIPERIVHARGTGAHGYFELETSLADLSRADFLQRPGERTPVFARFSTVAGGAGSVDLARDVRGFAVKFYTKEGNFDLVGNNIPVFFIQDALKFPDLIHAVKMEPDRGFPQAASAHDTFWDFASLMPESTHMLMWVMSDRAIPRSLRMIDGFGVHTFRLVNAKNESTFVKFHWRPKLGVQSVLWDEALKINGADNDYHRRDMWTAIEAGNFPEWELCLQTFTEEQAKTFDFDVLDPTKIVPEEIVPLTRVGRMVLDRMPENFFAETEQVAFCPANVVPGIDFSDDPLLQGRLFSYLDTQLSRLGGPNNHQIPVNAPKCPMHNFQRDGHMQMAVPKGRAAYEPNSLGLSAKDGVGGAERECPRHGYGTFPRPERGAPVRARPESFADHYSHARLFYVSQAEVEQNHIVGAFVFELSKVATPAIRERMVANLGNVDAALAQRVSEGLGLAHVPPPSHAAAPTKKNPTPSPSLSIVKRAKPTLAGRDVACMVTDGLDGAIFDALKAGVEKAGAHLIAIAPKVGGAKRSDGKALPADHAVVGAPSVLFDAVVILASPEGATLLASESAALDFVRDAYAHLKVIGHSTGAKALLDAAGLTGKKDEGLFLLEDPASTASFIKAASNHRIWSRERTVRVVR
jgi:catalase